jgi:hypothetical protein
MGNIQHTSNQGEKWMRYIARVLALIWACWWTFFGLIAGAGEGYGPSGILAHAAVPGLVFLVAAVIAWRWEVIGGILLLLEGLATLIVFWFSRTAEGFLTLTSPPLVAGLLFLAISLRARMSGTLQNSA